MLAPALSTALGAVVLGAAWYVHTRVHGFLPEDRPTPGRKRHGRPTPMAGALPAALSVGILLFVDRPWLAAGVLVAALVGLADDRRKAATDGLRWTTKAVGLALAVVLACVDLGASLALGPFGWLALGVGLFALTNATNFLDNTDGVAAGLGVVALGWIGGLCPARPETWLAGVWLAFVPFNWPQARMFLGDAGAYALGLLLAASATRAAAVDGDLAPWRALAPVAVFGIDFVQVVAARLWLGYAPWIGDRRHLTHVLIARGLPQRLVAPLLVTIAALLPLLARA
jgi:UDP-GlcNAc:undecaprenyl-phosphate GlcNAc-1-phosphate transferase